MTHSSRLSLDKRIPLIALIMLGLTCACSGVGAAVQVGQLKARFDEMSARQAATDRDHDTLIEVKADVRAIKDAIDRMEARQARPPP